MIGSENGRSADTYAVTSRDERSDPRQPPTNTAPATAAAHNASLGRQNRLLRAIGKVIELRHAVRFRPDADLPRVLERVIVPVQGLLAIERDGEMAALEINPQRVPLIGRHFHVRALLLG